MRKVIAIFGLTFWVAGCAASGVQVSEEQAQSFTIGKSTYSDVVASLGAPTTTVTQSNGNRISVYSYAAVSSRPQNFIPYLGPLVGGYDTKSSAVTFTFDSRGILSNMTSAQTGLGTGANLAAGSQSVPATSQPR